MAAHVSELHERPELLPPLALAYIGDAVYELFIRERLLEGGARKVGELHSAATDYVRARAQAQALRTLQPDLTPVEQEVARRGRNSAGRGPRSGDPAEYGQATAFEALVGYLYLSGARERLRQVLEAAVHAIEDPT